MTHDAWLAKYSPDFLDRMRHVCDPLADAAVASLPRQRPSAMLEEVERRAASEGGAFQRFLDVTHQVPAWIDWDAVEQARRVQLAFSTVRGIALLTSSLIEGYSLSNATHVLIATGRLHQDVTRRIYETGQMSHNMSVKDGMRPGGVGHRIVLEVRLLHAMVRKHLKQRGWNTARYGEPINQEDMAFTIIEFDYLALRGMERMGVTLSDSDRRAVHHFWRYAAWLHGVDTGMLTNCPAEEQVQYQQIRAHQYAPNDEGRLLALTVIRSLAHRPPFYLKDALLFEIARVCLGNALADCYELPRHRGWERSIMALQAINKAATIAHYRVPGVARASEWVNFTTMRNTLMQNLDPSETKRAFRHIA